MRKVGIVFLLLGFYMPIITLLFSNVQKFDIESIRVGIIEIKEPIYNKIPFSPWKKMVKEPLRIRYVYFLAFGITVFTIGLGFIAWPRTKLDFFPTERR